MYYTPHDIAREVLRLGFLPFFQGEIEGFSIEENISPDYWFPEGDGVEGVWEWKNDIIVDADCAYGKFYQGKACFVSMEWFPLLATWRRAHHTLTPDEQLVLDTVRSHGSLLSREIKKMCGYTAPSRRLHGNALERAAQKDNVTKKASVKKGYETTITRLQMGCQLVSAGFEYSYTRDGRRYGWSVTRYCTPEDFFGAERMQVKESPGECRRLLQEHLSHALPQASPTQITQLIG